MFIRTPILAAAVTLAVASCAAPPPPSAASRADKAALASCKASTDSAFNKQNRYLLSERSQTDTPFSVSGLPGVTTQGLTQQYDYDSSLQDCLAERHANTPNSGTYTSGAPSQVVNPTSPLLPP